jgi:hypothetical protein
MNSHERARALMLELDLIPDNHTTVKQQFAIEAALEEAAGLPQPDGREEELIERVELIAENLESPTPPQSVMTWAAEGLRELAADMRDGLGAALSREMRQMAGEGGEDAPAATDEGEHVHDFNRTAAYRIADGPAGDPLFIEWCPGCRDAFLIRIGNDGTDRIFVPEAEANLVAGVEREFLEQRLATATLHDEIGRKRVGELTDELAEAIRDRDARVNRTQRLENASRVLVGNLNGSDGFPAAWWLEAADALHDIERMVWPPKSGEVRGSKEDR